MGKINFYNVDCMLFMKDKPDNYYDLAIVDPPYAISIENSGTMFKKFGNTHGWDNEPPSRNYFNELFRVSKYQIIWGGNYFIENLKNTKCLIWWDKMNGTNMMADGEIAWTNFEKHSKRFQMHHFSKGYDEKIHPAQKPVKLYRWCLQNFAEKGWKLLDTHGGSMSSAIAADLEGYEMDITEIDKEYFENGVKRFEWHKRQLKLF